jgi:hypothetical protein
MKLTYRGVSYETQPPQLEVVEGGTIGSYRGAPWKAHTLVSAPPSQPAATLTYRGVRYQLGQGQLGEGTEAAVSGTAASTSVAAAERAPWLLPHRQQLNSALEAAHRHAILDNLERRLQAARSRGDDRLIRMLEAEWRQFA